MEKISEKMENLHEFYGLFCALWGNIMIITDMAYNGGFGGGDLEAIKIFQKTIGKSKI